MLDCLTLKFFTSTTTTTTTGSENCFYKHNLALLKLLFIPLRISENLPLQLLSLEQQEAYNLAGGKTGFDNIETKLPTYWNTPFSKICLGMKIGRQIKFHVINTKANSLFL